MFKSCLYYLKAYMRKSKETYKKNIIKNRKPVLSDFFSDKIAHILKLYVFKLYIPCLNLESLFYKPIDK